MKHCMVAVRLGKSILVANCQLELRVKFNKLVGSLSHPKDNKWACHLIFRLIYFMYDAKIHGSVELFNSLGIGTPLELLT